jgi:hypothetical protein
LAAPTKFAIFASRRLNLSNESLTAWSAIGEPNMTDGLGVLLDHVCKEIVGRSSPLEHETRLIVHPLVYRRVAELRPQKLARGLPLLLLGLELVPSEEVPPSGFKIAQ